MLLLNFFSGNFLKLGIVSLGGVEEFYIILNLILVYFGVVRGD